MFRWLARFKKSLGYSVSHGRIKSITFFDECNRLNNRAGKLKKTHTVFPSLCDWLDLEVPLEWFEEILHLIFDCENLDWLLLTKRPDSFWARMEDLAKRAHDSLIGGRVAKKWLANEPPANVWVGVSAENQAMFDRRLTELLRIPAEHRFLSLEPLLEPVIIDPSLVRGNVDWVIVGGESGLKARPCHVGWIMGIIQQCRELGIPCFVKQLGSCPVGVFEPLHPKGGDPAEWPEELCVREFPKELQKGL
jgi:protein gp37